MKKIETIYGYDVYELTKQECKEQGYMFPSVVVFCEGETYDTVGYDESSFETIEEARRYCKEYRCD